MSEQNIDLINMCKDLYTLEKEARDIYASFLVDLKDEFEIKVIDKIRQDEVEHMKIAQEMLKIAENI